MDQTLTKGNQNIRLRFGSPTRLPARLSSYTCETTTDVLFMFCVTDGYFASMTRFGVFFLSLAGACLAATFNPECPLPPAGTTFVGGPNIRSTTGILWNCLSVLILCTWSIQHLNVPNIRPPAKGFIPKLWRTICKAGTKIKWMIVTILIPEFILSKALGEWVSSRECRTLIEGLTKSLEHPWGPTHIRLANMGYFVLDMGEKWPIGEVANLDGSTWIGESKSCHINRSRLRHRYWALNTHQWRNVVEHQLADFQMSPSNTSKTLTAAAA
jgi:hypothetical protein